MSALLVFRLPVLSRASCSWLERNVTNYSRSSSGRPSSSAFLSSLNTFAYWVILLCRGISRFADVNILTASLPKSHTKVPIAPKTGKESKPPTPKAQRAKEVERPGRKGV